MTLNVRNCPRCGKVFARTIHDVCPACIQKIEDDYQSCLKYLRENRGCTIRELSDETEVSIRQITKFIRESRISLMDAPNMSYPCESCGVLIREHNLCQECRSKLMKDMQNVRPTFTDKQEQNSDKGGVFRYKK